ncbi:MAG TPA: hypothetical protein VHN74_13125 [Candidatus Angelobacter sp.]|jgi:ElaB/YqjD/DUF883 family membrane-anchored ribosome-binding protein|nr:hypothetical protein [Candidatus Angelobacter sp.]
MTSETVEFAGEQIEEGLEKLKDFSGKLKKSFVAAGNKIEHGWDKTCTVAKDTVQDARSGIRKHPLTVVTATAGTGLLLGAVLGWWIGKRR